MQYLYVSIQRGVSDKLGFEVSISASALRGSKLLLWRVFFLAESGRNIVLPVKKVGKSPCDCVDNSGIVNRRIESTRYDSREGSQTPKRVAFGTQIRAKRGLVEWTLTIRHFFKVAIGAPVKHRKMGTLLAFRE